MALIQKRKFEIFVSLFQLISQTTAPTLNGLSLVNMFDD